MYHDLGRQGHAARVPAGHRPARGPRGQQGARAQLHPARHQGHDQRPLRRRERHRRRRRRPAHRRPRGQGGQRRSRAEMLLVAAGRATNVEDVGLETTKAEVDRGFVKVDGHMRTKEPHLYAIGDIVGGLQLAHTAAHEGIIAAHTIAGDPDVHAMDYVKQPRATYCRPEIASVGLTEQQCEERGLADQDRQGPVPGHRQGDHRRRVRGLRQDHRRQGDRRDARVHIIGPHATDLIAEALAGASSSRRRRGRSAPTTHAHPTSRRSSARPRWRSTAGRSTSRPSRRAGRRPVAGTAGPRRTR